MTTAKGVTEVTGNVTIGFRKYEGRDEKGRTIALKIFDDDTYGYYIDGKVIDSGQKLSEYSCVYDPMDGREADSEALCFECRPGYDDDGSCEPYVFVHSRMYEALGVDA